MPAFNPSLFCCPVFETLGARAAKPFISFDKYGTKHDLAEERDFVAHAVEPRVHIPHGHVNLDAVEEVLHRRVREHIGGREERVRPPRVDCEAGVDRMVGVEDRAWAREQRPLLRLKPRVVVQALRPRRPLDSVIPDRAIQRRSDHTDSGRHPW